jgi:hypothetical protein
LPLMIPLRVDRRIDHDRDRGSLQICDRLETVLFARPWVMPRNAVSMESGPTDAQPQIGISVPAICGYPVTTLWGYGDG